MQEWSPSKKWNPFNSYKLLAQVYRWQQIERGQPIPQPGLITVDPTNKCNLKCDWCNADFILSHNDKRLSDEFLMELAEFLPKWRGSPNWAPGVEAICIAGGGEPLLHPRIGEFIERCVANGVEVGVVTNGSNMDKLLEPLSKCTWVGVSVDAGSAKTYLDIKHVDLFEKVCENIAALTDYIRSRECRLGSGRPGYGVSYKYLLTPTNIQDIVPAVARAKALGCTNFHLRPAGTSWDKLGQSDENRFSENAVEILDAAFQESRQHEDDNFGIFGITHKFDRNLNKANIFTSCHAIFMTAVIMPPRDPAVEAFRLGLCCDRRGDTGLEFQGPLTETSQIAQLWGSPEHWQIYDTLELSKCPRCTYQPHNQIFEHVIQEDSMTFKFI